MLKKCPFCGAEQDDKQRYDVVCGNIWKRARRCWKCGAQSPPFTISNSDSAKKIEKEVDRRWNERC